MACSLLRRGAPPPSRGPRTSVPYGREERGSVAPSRQAVRGRPRTGGSAGPRDEGPYAPTSSEMRARTASIWLAGVLAPAVMPMSPAPSNHSGQSSSSPSTWWVRGQRAAEISARAGGVGGVAPADDHHHVGLAREGVGGRLVAGGGLADGVDHPHLLRDAEKRRRHLGEKGPGGAVVCTTTPTLRACGRAAASSAEPTTTAPGACGSVASTSGWPASPTTTT